MPTEEGADTERPAAGSPVASDRQLFDRKARRPPTAPPSTRGFEPRSGQARRRAPHDAAVAPRHAASPRRLL